MKYKLLFLLPVLALALAAGLTNCAKDAESAVASAVDQSATERGNCWVRITTDGNAQVCGSQTNTNYCNLVPGQTWATWPGVESITAGTTAYNLATPCDFSITNTSGAVLNVKIQTPGGILLDQLAVGQSRGYHVDGNCVVTKW